MTAQRNWVMIIELKYTRSAIRLKRPFKRQSFSRETPLPRKLMTDESKRYRLHNFIMGLSCTKVQGPKQRNVQGPKKKGTLLRFWKRLRRTTPRDTDTATMAEGGHEMASDCPAGNQQDDNVQQESSPLDKARSDMEKDGGQQESSPFEEASSVVEKDDRQQESSPLDEAGSVVEKIAAVCLRCRIIRSRLGRGTQSDRAAAPRLRSKLDRRQSKSESDLGKAPEKLKRRMRQFNKRRSFPNGTKSDTELVRPTRVQP